MSDPVGLIGGGGLRPIEPPGAGRTPAGGSPADPAGPSFKDVLKGNLREVNKLQQDATRAMEDLATGKRDDLETVLTATQKADAAFRMLLAVRNKMMEAYQEIKDIRV